MDNELTKEEKRLIFVIRSTNIVESKMKKIILAFIGTPSQKQAFVSSYLLNNSTISFGAKVKLVLAIAKELSVQVKRDPFHVLLSRRNAFAHQDHLDSVRMVTQPDGMPDVSYVVESIKGSGSLEVVTQDKAFSEFIAAYGRVESDLEKLIAELGE